MDAKIIRLKNVYERWFSIRETFPANRYKEISLERLAKNRRNTVKDIYDFLGLDKYSKMSQDVKILSKRQVHAARWRTEIDKRDKQLVESRMGEIIRELGYSHDG